MANDYYQHTNWPVTSSDVSSSPARNEMSLVESGFDKLPTISGNGDNAVFVNATGTALEAFSASAARTLLGLAIGSDVQAKDSTVLDVLATTSNVADKMPYFTTSTTAGVLTFRDEDTMVSNDALGVCSGASIRNYLANQFNTLDATLTAPTDTKCLFYQAAAPTGWTIQVGLDGYGVVTVTSGTAGGTTFGSVLFNAAVISGADSGHTHDWSASGTTDAGNTITVQDVTGTESRPINTHTHTYSTGIQESGTSSATHTHTWPQAAGQYAVLASKN